MTRKVRFIHAADLHLGAPTRGLGALSEEWAARLCTTISEAYDRVIEAALSRGVDFVVLAGDMFDSSHPSYCDYLLFFEGLEKLHEAGIPVYLVTGNHDPYTSWARDIARLPESAHMLGIGVPTFELFERDGDPLCLIGGRSYYGQAWPLDEGISDGITRENAIGALSEAHPNAADAPFAIGVIHTGLDLDASKAATDEDTLLAQDIDYWACGHLHRHLVRPIADDPRIVFPGCVQGRDIKEVGERGCYLVELDEGVSPRIEFIPTASVVFHSLDVDVSQCLTLSEMESLVKTELFRENGHDLCSEMVSRVNLVGKTDLHEFLRQADVIAGMRRHINDACPGFFCDAIVDRTTFAAAPAERIAFPENVDGELIDYVQSTLVQRGIAVPDALARRMGDFRTSAEMLVRDLVDERGDGLDLPAARGEVARRIAAYVDRSDGSGQSLFLLGNRLEAAYVSVRGATEVAAALQQDDRELRALEEDRAGKAARVSALTDEIEDLVAWHSELEALDADIAGRQSELSHLHEAAVELSLLADDGEPLDRRLLELSAQDDRALRDELEERAAERDRIMRAVDEAKERSSLSSAAYEALLEVGEDERHTAGYVANRSAQITVSVLLPVMFMAAGIPLFIHGRQVNSLSFTIFGTALVVLAFFLAAAALVVLFRPNKDAEALESRRQDARWVMLQEKKLLDARIAEKEQFEGDLRELLDRSGLQAAGGSVRQALLLLDDARGERARIAERRQRAMALEMHEQTAGAALDELETRRRAIEQAAGLDSGAPARTVEAAARARAAERDELQGELETADARREALVCKLEQARCDRSFDRLKLDYQQARARLRIAKHDYVTLLLAQRLLGE